MQRQSRREAIEKAKKALERVGLLDKVNNLPSQLSGGEQQRVSIARAVAHSPKILFADEPTANLDNESSRAVLEIFKEFHRSGQTIIMVTHEKEYAENAERVIQIDDGQIVKARHTTVKKKTRKKTKKTS